VRRNGSRFTELISKFESPSLRFPFAWKAQTLAFVTTPDLSSTSAAVVIQHSVSESFSKVKARKHRHQLAGFSLTAGAPFLLV
jgi:hypothetical protein